jgi:Cu(I)/Ag(I) efflux system membrane fusion protein
MAVLVDVFDRDANLARPGQHAEVRVPDVPGRVFPGTVESVESDIDIGARSLKARVRLNRPDAALKPNMLAEVVIHGAPVGRQSLFIPREALIRTGRRNAVVLALGEGRFQPVEVVPGRESDDWVEIVKGIKEGDTVVTSGQFLIDSEANVRASFSRMQPPTAAEGEEKKP